MIRTLANAARHAALLVITIAACFAMWWTSQKAEVTTGLGGDSRITPPALAAQPRLPVVAVPVSVAKRDVTVRYSGKITPWETFSLGFEIAGRVDRLGENAAGRPLDEGDRVEGGQVLARLDDRVLRAQLAEAAANFELASSELDRASGARDVISESEYQSAVAQRAQSAAAQEMSEKRLEDSTLRAPVSGVLSRRSVQAGESVGANTPVFELVENDRVRLVLNVPEARVRELELRRRQVESDAARSSEDPEDRVFRARVQLEGADLYGAPWPRFDARVYRIAETADAATGLFEVEVEVGNDSGLLRPGMVATADLVTDRVLAYEVPESAVLFREGATYAYEVTAESAGAPVLFWEVGDTRIDRARRIDLPRWIDQGDHVLIPAEGTEFSNIVTRGQQRLREGQLVRRLPAADAAAGVAGRSDSGGAG